MSSVTDRTGAVWNIVTTTTGNDSTVAYYKPGASAPYLTNNVGLGPSGRPVVLSQDFADGRHFAYTYTTETYYIAFVNGEEVDKDMDVGTGYTVSNAATGTSLTTAVEFGSNGNAPPTITPGPKTVTDPSGRTYKWNYDLQNGSNNAPLLGVTMPEGNGETYTYDAYRNVTKVDRAPKPGSTLAHVVTTSTFGNCATLANLIACNKPTATVDANGNQTDITYDPTHGGVLTESLPAGPDGIRPVKRYAYVQRYAWISNGGGGFVHAASPIWLLASEKSCRTTATNVASDSCDGGSTDEVVTSYDYGPDTGVVGNTLLLRGKAVTAGGVTLRTCYRYDALGSRISETAPRAGLAVCP